MKAGYLPKLLFSPSVLLVLVCVYGYIMFTVYLSFTGSTLMPSLTFTGAGSYVRLAGLANWRVSLANFGIFASLYIVIERPGGEAWSLARRISSFVPDTAEWGRAVLVARPPFKPEAEDRIKAFVWNDGQGPLFIQDLRFEAFAR